MQEPLPLKHVFDMIKLLQIFITIKLCTKYLVAVYVES